MFRPADVELEFDAQQISDEVQKSRRLILNVLDALDDQHDALTIIGAHAVIERTAGLEGQYGLESTSDGDLGVQTNLVSTDSDIASSLRQAGLVPLKESSPGIWCYAGDEGDYAHDNRLSIDLISDYSTSSGGSRHANLPNGDRRSVMRTKGTELSVIDRDEMNVRAFDGGPGRLAYVAGPTALICAKAWKLHDVLHGAERDRQRFRLKDVGDIWRLMQVVEPGTSQEIFMHGESVPALAENVLLGRHYLVELHHAGDLDTHLRDYLADFISTDVDEEVRRVDEWMNAFQAPLTPEAWRQVRLNDITRVVKVIDAEIAHTQRDKKDNDPRERLIRSRRRLIDLAKTL